MWLKFLYFCWFVLPVMFFIFYAGYLLQEIRRRQKSPDDLVIRSKYYLQIAIYTLFCAGLSVVINRYILTPYLPDLQLHTHALIVAQIVLYPLIIAMLAPYAGKNKAPETLQDTIKRYGLEDPRSRAALERSKKKFDQR